ncbi:MAG: YitT family protein, partial [Bacteroidia bacterium]|nr:YitT family protein [Bacteroidia bacterium]
VTLQIIDLPVITHDKLLIAVFGGVFLGAGSGLTIRGGAALDGSEVLAVYVSKRIALTVGDFIALFNILLFSAAIFFINTEAALYSMLTYFSASKTIDFLLNGVEEYIGVTIISQHSEAIRKTLIHSLGRAVTVYKAESGFLGPEKERKVLFCVVTRLEVSRLLNEIEKIDNKAFVVQHTIKDTKGGMIKKRPLH